MIVNTNGFVESFDVFKHKLLCMSPILYPEPVQSLSLNKRMKSFNGRRYRMDNPFLNSLIAALKQLQDMLVPSGEDIEETEELRLIREAVMALPENYRIAIILYYYCGYRCAEIADILKMKEPTVKTHLKRARDKLKIQLREEICYDQQG